MVSMLIFNSCKKDIPPYEYQELSFTISAGILFKAKEINTMGNDLMLIEVKRKGLCPSDGIKLTLRNDGKEFLLPN